MLSDLTEKGSEACVEDCPLVELSGVILPVGVRLLAFQLIVENPVLKKRFRGKCEFVRCNFNARFSQRGHEVFADITVTSSNLDEPITLRLWGGVDQNNCFVPNEDLIVRKDEGLRESALRRRRLMIKDWVGEILEKITWRW